MFSLIRSNERSDFTEITEYLYSERKTNSESGLYIGSGVLNEVVAMWGAICYNPQRATNVLYDRVLYFHDLFTF